MAVSSARAAPTPSTFDAAWAAALPSGAQVDLPPGSYRGPWTFQHRIELRAAKGAILHAPSERPAGATLTLRGGGRIEGLSVEEPAKGFGVRLEGAPAFLRDLDVWGPGEAAVYATGGEVTLQSSDLSGGEYGLLMKGPGSLQLTGNHFHALSRAGVALIGAKGTLTRNRLEGPFGEGALTFTHCSDLTLQDNTITQAGAIGIKLLTSTARLSGDRIQGARSDPQGLEGDGIYLYQSQLTADGERIAGAQGMGLLILGSRATLRAFRIEDSGQASLYVDGQSQVELTGSTLRQAPLGAWVEQGGRLQLGKAMTFEGVGRQVLESPR